MSELFRFGVSIDKSLLDRFDRLIKRKKYTNRSEAFRDLIRDELVRREWAEGKEVAGAITFVYGHHQPDLLNKLMEIQHRYHGLIISAQHIHLDHRHCLEILAVKGNPGEVQQLADRLRSVKGVRHGTLSMSSKAQDLE
jgi:CopG family transcriptional regulator, nickel-responsive regulator